VLFCQYLGRGEGRGDPGIMGVLAKESKAPPRTHLPTTGLIPGFWEIFIRGCSTLFSNLATRDVVCLCMQKGSYLLELLQGLILFLGDLSDPA
jgi:hypothetical protein